MVEKQNVKKALMEKIKAFAMGLIGAGFFVWGITYFQEQESYYVPRILLPVYEFLGNIGLAIGMIILGLILVYIAFSKFKQSRGKVVVFIIYQGIITLVMAILIFLSDTNVRHSNLDDSGKSSEEITQQKIEETERPVMNNAAANTYLDKLEGLLVKVEKIVKEKNQIQFDEFEQEYLTVIEEVSTIIQDISKEKNYNQFALYNAEIINQINVLRSDYISKTAE